MVTTAKSLVEKPLETPSDLAFQSTTIDLKRATALLARVADRKSSIAILGYTAIIVRDTGVVLAATDLNVYATVNLDIGKGAHRSGGFCVEAKALADLAKALPPADASISRAGALGLTISVGNVSSVLHGLPFRDFPKFPDPADLAWHPTPADALGESLDAVLFSVCKDETRFHLNGVHYENPDGERAIFVSTDGHRLSKATRTMSGAPTKGVIIPAKAAKEISKLLAEGKRQGQCETAIHGHGPHMFVRYGAVTLAVKLIDAQFPPYEQVIPKDHTILATIERKPLIDALKRAKLACSEVRGVKFDLASGKLVITSDHPERGTATETLTADALDGKKVTIGVNPAYLLDLLASIDCKHVTFSFGGELAPMLVRSTHDAVEYSLDRAPYVGVVMPMRI